MGHSLLQELQLKVGKGSEGWLKNSADKLYIKCLFMVKHIYIIIVVNVFDLSMHFKKLRVQE
jgi:hypothetical protein